MTIYDSIFPLAIGTNRFRVSGKDKSGEVEQAAQIVLRALDAGVNYIDTAHTYSKGVAHAVLKLAFAQTKKPYSVTVKSMLNADRNADGARRRVESSLTEMGIDHASHFLCWSVMSYDEFEQITRPGGIYEAAERMKSEGLIDHICLSAHASIKDTIRILESGAFEGVTISFSMLHSDAMMPIIKRAAQLNIGVAAMNPLGGGIIPQNKESFSFACGDGESTVTAALRYAAAFPAVNPLIAGISSIEELDECLSAFTNKNTQADTDRVIRVNTHMCKLENYCTGCGYCAPCPQGIPISEIMQSRNTLHFGAAKSNNREGKTLLQNIHLFHKLNMSFSFVPDTSDNPCIRCGQCEKNCTQHLRIIDLLDDTYKRMKRTGFSKAARRERFKSLLDGRKKVGLYTAGGYTSYVLSQYRTLIGEPDFEIVLFDSNPHLWGKTDLGMTIHAPSEIPLIAPEAVLICNYNHESAIFDSIVKYQQYGIDILKLHEPDEVPWLY